MNAMPSMAFDTLRASRTLRDAGVEERMAEAIVAVVGQTAGPPSIEHLATRDDLQLTKAELRAESGALRTEIAGVRAEIAAAEGRLRETLRQQGWAQLGAMTALLGLAVAAIRLLPGGLG
jgi:hypothetical protein